ncbi:hypothetical protein L6452_06542 [Arctium lappa]|uniref:Uncharacterized protein n=1 Tax=Arctium lappa TaxID=4217 RepID=A0ACB9EJ75_ARCLA|nr:hypothetical protein L6452_06542 [Arctium lappa]
MFDSGVGAVCAVLQGKIGTAVLAEISGFSTAIGEGNRSGKFEQSTRWFSVSLDKVPCGLFLSSTAKSPSWVSKPLKVTLIVHVGNFEAGFGEIPRDLVVGFGLDLPRGVEVLDFPCMRSSDDFSNSGCMFVITGYF